MFCGHISQYENFSKTKTKNESSVSIGLLRRNKINVKSKPRGKTRNNKETRLQRRCKLFFDVRK